jgi:adenine phosphoribosyltransferase
LQDRDAYRAAIERLHDQVKDLAVDLVVGMESRGFIFAAPLAYLLRVGFVPVRKLGKLPAETLSVEYELEYGTNTLEIHRDAIAAGQRVLVVDDLLATGGTVAATVDLVRQLGGEVVGTAFLIELPELGGRSRLDGHPVFTVLSF